MNDLGAKMDSYNGMLSTVDSLLNEIEGDERSLRDKNAVCFQPSKLNYGSDSSEYEQAGGTRRSERRRSSKKGPTEG